MKPLFASLALAAALTCGAPATARAQSPVVVTTGYPIPAPVVYGGWTGCQNVTYYSPAQFYPVTYQSAAVAPYYTPCPTVYYSAPTCCSYRSYYYTTRRCHTRCWW